MPKIFYCCIVIIFSLFSTIVKAQEQVTAAIETKELRPSRKIIIKYGIASFYAKKFNGRKTSNGAIFSSAKMTAACNVLPLGTWVKVTNLRNNKSVVVEINDHLHHRNTRLIDLSKTAAQKLGYVSRGITRVKVEVLGKMMTN